jgi:signal transduction histidine kinase/CheY-like chemotaxis protein
MLEFYQKKLLAIICVVCLLATILFVINFRETREILKNTLYDQTRMIYSALDRDTIMSFPISPETFDQPDYTLIVSILMDIFRDLPNKYENLWIMVQNLNDDLVFLVDIERDFPENINKNKLRKTRTTIPVIAINTIGIVYSDQSGYFNYVLETKKSNVFGPFRDEYGVWVSSVIPKVCPDTNDILYLVGIDFNYSEFKWVIFRRLLYPIILTITLFLSFVLGYHTLESAKRVKLQRDMLKKISLNYDKIDLSDQEIFDSYAQILRTSLNADEVSIWILSPDKSKFIRKTISATSRDLISDQLFIPYENLIDFMNMFIESGFKTNKKLLSIPAMREFYINTINRKIPKSMLVTTITNQFEIDGFIVVESMQTGRYWTSDEESFLEAVLSNLNKLLHQKEKIETEKNILRLNARFINTFESMTDGFMYFNKDHVLKFINRNTLSIFDYEQSPYYDKYCEHLQQSALFYEKHSETVSAGEQNDLTKIHGELWNCIPEEMTELIPNLLERAITEHSNYTETVFIDSLHKWIEFRVHYHYGEVSLLFNDITQKKEAEKTAIEHQRLSAISDMTNSFSHEFNNSLQILMSNIEVLNQKLATNNAVQDYLKIIYLTTNDAATRVSLLQRFSGTKRKHSIYSYIFINSIISDAITQSIPIWKTEPAKKGVAVKLTHNLGNIPTGSGNDSEIRFVFYSLIKNAIDAMPDGGDIHIETKSSGTDICIYIIDTGEGMTDEEQKRAFEPFFTTRGYTAGKGLGLSSVLNIISEHGGSIRIISSKKGEGTTIEIVLPGIQVDQTTTTISNQKKKEKPFILWVDDDSLIREIGFEILQSLGYEAMMAESGAVALEILENDCDRYDIILSDIGMPEMDGWQFIAKVDELYPGKYIKAMITGWGAQIEDEKKNEFGLFTILSKPIKLADMKTMLENMWR